jgi:HlyD family secretion protein
MHKLKPLLFLAIILAAAAGGYRYFTQNPAQLTQLQLKFGLITEAEATGLHKVSGFIEADQVNVAAEAGGRIAWIAVDEGDPVEAGQAIVELDSALLNAQIRQAQAKVATAQANLAKVQAGIRVEEIAKAQAGVAVAQAKTDATHMAWQDAITVRDNPQELDMQIDAARTAVDLAELRLQQTIPLKDAGEAVWDAWRLQWEWLQEPHRFCKEMFGQSFCKTFRADEAQKQDAGVAWNYAGADMWQAWAGLNSAVTARADAETTLTDLLRQRNDPQLAQVKVAQAEAAYQTALAEVAVAEAAVAKLEAVPRPEQVAIVQAQVEQAQANLRTLQVQQAKYTLTAAVSGWVVDRVAHEGEMAVPGASLLTLADLTKVTLTVYVPEPDIDTVSIGQTINVFVDAFPGQPFTGVITHINTEAEFTPKNVQTKEERVNTVFAVKIRLDNQEQLLKPGMPADAVLTARPEL